MKELDPTREEIDTFLNENFTLTDEFDREEAIYWLAANYHSGQGSNLYSILSTSEFRPGPLSSIGHGPSEEIYLALVERFTNV